MSVLLVARKDIPNTTSNLISANRKLSLKNLSLLFLSDTRKMETTILKVFRVLPSTFETPTLVFQILRPNQWAKTWLITLNLLPESNKASVWSLKITRYQIQGTHSNFSSVLLPVIYVKVAKIATTFFTFWNTYWHGDLFVYMYNIWYDSSPCFYLCFCLFWQP